MKERILHYAHHDKLLDWVRLGWIIAKSNCETTHDYYNVSVEWLCQCPIVRPQDR